MRQRIAGFASRLQYATGQLTQFKDAARVMGDPQLLKLMEEASFMIKRDVIFAASLYVQ